MLNTYLPDWLNVIFSPLLRQLPLKRGRVLAKSALSHKLSLQSPLHCLTTPHANNLPPQLGHFIIDGIA
jgi:hypothetical protein